MTVALVAAGGAVGAALRYLVGRRFATSDFPWGTLLVNGAGCLLLGLVAQSDNSWVRTLLGTGVAGALTTYSSFALESVLLERNGHRARAVANVAATFVLGGLAFTVGWLLG
jgi:fluoride exporter